MVKISINPQTNLQEDSSPNRGSIKIERGNEMYANANLAESYAYDSMNFTNTYTDDLSKYNNYDVPTTRFFNWDEQRAQNQGTGEKWVNGLSKAGVTTLGAVAENTLGIVFGIGELVTGGAYYDNYIGKSIDKANEAMREAMPNYKTQAEQDMSTGQKLGTANFWADTVANGVGYSLGSIATFYLTGGVGLVARGAKAMQIYNTSKAIANGLKVADSISKGKKLTGFVNLAAMGEMGLYMSLAESSVEARETQKSVYEDLIAKEIENPDNNINDISQLSVSELEDIENTSYAAANRNFLTQLPVLMGTNLLMFGKQIAGFKASTKVNKDIAFDQALGKTVNTIANQGKFRNAISRLKPTGAGVLTEAGQEGWQFASNVMSSDYHTDKYFNGGAASLTKSLYKGIKDTLGSQEGLESMLVGGIVGGGVSGVSSTVRGDFKRRQKAAELVTDVLNGGYLVNANNKQLQFNAQVKVALDMENARKTGDIKAFKDAQFKLIQYNAFAALENGGYDVFMQKLEDSKTLNDKDFSAMFGYNPEVSLEEQLDGKTKNEVIKNVQDKLSKFKETYKNINELFPPIPKTSGLPRLRLSEEEKAAEDAVYEKRENLRGELILTASGIENRTERIESIQKQMKDVITAAERLNGIKVLSDVDLLLEPGENLLLNKDGKYDGIEEINIIAKSFKEIENELASKKAIAALAPFNKLAQDYLSLFTDNAVAIERYNQLSSSKYFQDLFDKTVKENQAEAEQLAKEKEANEDIDAAETSDQVKESVPSDANSNTKMAGKVKAKGLKKEEQAAVKKYLDLHRGKPVKEQLRHLQNIANNETDLSPTERKGLEVAIKNLDSKVKKNKKVDTVEILTEDVAEEITMTEDNIVRADNNDKIASTTPKKRPVRKKGKVSDDKRNTESKPTSVGDLNIVSATNADEVVNIGTESEPNYKVPVDNNGNVIEPNPDNVEGKPIILQPDLLLADDVIGEDVTFEIIENDWWNSGEFRDPSFTEDWMHIPIYYKIGNAYIGKLEASIEQDRKAIVDKLQQGKVVSTKISKIESNNFNNTVDDTTAPYFHNPENTFGKEDDILLGFTTIGEDMSVQWTLSEVSDDKNKNKELDLIASQVQKDVSAGSTNQIGIVIKQENNPAGTARMSIASTANLNVSAQNAVLKALSEQNYELASSIVANSDQRTGANTNNSYLEFSEYESGQKYIVYASPTLGKLIRINEDELKKSLDESGASVFNTVTEIDDRFEGPQLNTTESNINIGEDLSLFLEGKKYHVDRALGNTKGIYISPVTNLEYPSYQHYLFASKELGDEVRVEGSGYNAILTTDITKKGESMFNSPRVTFEKGDVLGETPGEVINNTKLAETSPETSVVPGTKKKKFKRGSKSKGIIDNLGENCK